MSSVPPNPRLALALSGGGVRATVFHLGVLLRLARDDRLEDIVALSTVSGGSLAVGLVFAESDLQWPTAARFTNHVLPRLRHLLTGRSLQGRAVRMAMMRPWTLFGSRGQLFAAALSAEWGIDGTIKRLPAKPLWSINATSYETGRNWRFTRNHIGDYKFGHNYSQDVPIATAMAASAAIPYMAGLVRLALSTDGWQEVDPATEKPIRAIARLRPAIRLWDGGVYENLGIESIWKPSGLVNRDIDFMIVSDASAYLPLDFATATGVLMLRPPFLRPPRLFDIATDQVRSLRSRMLMDAIVNRNCPASILRIGRSVAFIDRAARRTRPDASKRIYLDEAAAEAAGRYPTKAIRITANDFDLLIRHGFETADATLTGHAATVFQRSLNWE